MRGKIAKIAKFTQSGKFGHTVSSLGLFASERERGGGTTFEGKSCVVTISETKVSELNDFRETVKQLLLMSILASIFVLL